MPKALRQVKRFLGCLSRSGPGRPARRTGAPTEPVDDDLAASHNQVRALAFDFEGAGLAQRVAVGDDEVGVGARRRRGLGERPSLSPRLDQEAAALPSLRTFEDVCAGSGTIAKIARALEDEGLTASDDLEPDTAPATRRGTFADYTAGCSRFPVHNVRLSPAAIGLSSGVAVTALARAGTWRPVLSERVIATEPGE